MKAPWSRESVRILPAKVDLTGQPWCREALLLHVKGNGAMRWETRDLPPEADPYESAYCLTLRGTPLLSWKTLSCETCASWLCAGWGLDTAECPELEVLQRGLNNGFACLKDTASALSPLLVLLPEGCYVLAEGDAYPACGGGRFFWDAPDRLTPSPATGMARLDDDDFESQYERLPPVFLYPSQRRSRLDLDRVDYYRDRFQRGGPVPHGLALSVQEGMSLLLDGHHKAAAVALLGRTLPCLMVLRLEHYELRPVTAPPFHRVPVIPRRYERYAGCFGPFTIPIKDMGGVKLPEKPWEFVQGAGSLPDGRLTDAELPMNLLSTGKRYPTAEEYALVSAAEISYPTDKDLEAWLAAPEKCRPQLRAALVLLRSREDPRLKKVALRCAAVGCERCSLKEEAFRALAEMKGDPDAEAFFIDFFVNQEELPRVQSGWEEHLTDIAHSFWM